MEALTAALLVIYLWQGLALGTLFCIAGLHLQGLFNHPIGEGVEVGGERFCSSWYSGQRVSFTKLRLRRAITVVRRWP